MDIGKTGVPVTPTKHDHLVPYQVGGMVPFALWDVACRGPFLPREAGRVGDIECPNIVERRLAVSTPEHDEEIAVQDGGVRSTGWGQGRDGRGDVWSGEAVCSCHGGFQSMWSSKPID